MDTCKNFCFQRDLEFLMVKASGLGESNCTNGKDGGWVFSAGLNLCVVENNGWDFSSILRKQIPNLQYLAQRWGFPLNAHSFVLRVKQWQFQMRAESSVYQIRSILLYEFQLSKCVTGETIVKVQKHFPRVVFAEELCQGGRWGGATCISAGLVSFTKPISATGWHLKGPHSCSCQQKKPIAEQKFLAPFCMRSSRLVLPWPSWRRFHTQQRGHLAPQLGCSQGFRMHWAAFGAESFCNRGP